jgi:hypothetical protein
VLNFRAPLVEAEIEAFFAALAMPEAAARYEQLRPFYSFRMLGYCAVRSQTAKDQTIVEMYQRAIAAELAQ